MTDLRQITIDVVSDVVCPWCFIGRQRLDKALGLLDDIRAEVRWRPFQLDPTIPEGGLDRHAYMLAKFGSEERLEEIHANMQPLGEAEGIAFDFNAINVSPNTLDARRVSRWASNADNDVQHQLVGDLFSRYFERGENIGDRQVLIEAARESGMDAALVETLLASGADADSVSAEIETAQTMGVTGVPFFLLAGKYAVIGAQPADALAQAIIQVVDEAAPA